MAGASYAEGDRPMLTVSEMEACWAAYRGDAPADDPELSPLCGDLAGPAARADRRRRRRRPALRRRGYAEALRAAGVETELARYPDMTHGFLRWGGVVDRSRELVGELAGFAADRLPDMRKAR